MTRLLRYAFYLLVVRPVTLIVLGLHVRHAERLPREGPAVLAANHNSHLDTMVLMSLFRMRDLARVRPVAARDYFCRNRFLEWFAIEIIGIIPIDRKGRTEGSHPLDPVSAAIERGDIVIFFPEGSRGEPEERGDFKVGIAHLAERHPDCPVVPIYIHGLGKALPKGEAVLVPFFCDVFIGDTLRWGGCRDSFMDEFASSMNGLVAEEEFPPWE